MDIVGVPGVEAEAELLAAIAMLLKVLKLGPQDIAIKVSSRKVLQALLASYGVPDSSFGPVCIVVDKLDKMPAAQVGIAGIIARSIPSSGTALKKWH